MKKTKIVWLFAGIFSLFQGAVMCQNTVAFCFNSQVTASGYGAQWVPSLIFTHGQNALSAGAILSKDGAELAGVKIKYEYTVTGQLVGDSANRLELFFFANAAYYHNATLGSRVAQQENQVNPDMSLVYLHGMRFKSVELYGGTGLRVPFLKRFKWINYAGVGYYQSLSSECSKLYREAKGLGLFLSTGILVTIKG